MPHVIILAAGKGARMRSDLPKVLHPIGGIPMIGHVLRATEPVCARPSIVVGHRAGDVMRALGEGLAYVRQEAQRGTGDAVRCALEAHAMDDRSIVVLPGDHPFVTSGTVRRLVEAREAEDAAVSLATVRLSDFEGPRAQFSDCGRILRDAGGNVSAIVERKHATEEQARIAEVNVSSYCFRGPWLAENAARLFSGRDAGEYYLTDLLAVAAAQREKVVAVELEDMREGLGVNTPEQLLAACAAA